MGIIGVKRKGYGLGNGAGTTFHGFGISILEYEILAR
jgi:hypothetical protein